MMDDDKIEEIIEQSMRENMSVEYSSSGSGDENMEIEDEMNYDTLVIAGGSTKGILALGALQYAIDNYMLSKIKTYIGTSAGAMICYLLAIGYTPIEIIVYICSHQLMEKLVHFNIVAMINNQGASSYNAIHEIFEKMTINKIGAPPGGPPGGPPPRGPPAAPPRSGTNLLYTLN
jgi:peptidase E